MKPRILTAAYYLLLLPLFASVAVAKPDVALNENALVTDLTKVEWSYQATEPEQKATYESVMQLGGWKPIGTGQRWEFLGHPELAAKTVWVKLNFRASAESKKNKIGFFASMIDDEASVYLNGQLVGRAKYLTGGKVPHPVDMDLTPHVRFGGDNLLVVEIRDVVTQRMGGILGNVCLYQTLPYARTATGGIRLLAETNEKLSVLLHVGDALLAQGGRTTFSPSELAGLEAPPSILRDDELVLVAPARSTPKKKFLLVELANVNPTTARAGLKIACGKLPREVGRYELLRIPVEVAGTYTNPFDPRQISVEALVETPSGHVEKVSAFFGQDFAPVDLNDEEEVLLPVKGNPWKLYYRPRELGVHRVEILAQDGSGLTRTAAGDFRAIESKSKGYLRVSRNDPRFFEFDNGESFYGTGPSGWFRGSRFLFGGNTRWVPVTMLDAYYARKGANASTFEYLSTFHFGTLYLRDGFIDQHVAWKMEHALRTMEKYGIYWVVFHDDVLRSYQNGFDTLPYSRAQGGPARDINEVYTNPRALEMQKDQLRYMVSRLSDSPSLWIWNCGDESQPGNKFSTAMVRDWLMELHNYVRQIDVYGHAHSIGEDQYSILNGGDVALLPDWYYHDHNRGDENDQKCNGEPSRDPIAYNLCLQEKFVAKSHPIINIEGGICQWNNFEYLSGEKYMDWPEAIDFHQHLWISLFTKAAAGGTEWLCNMVDKKGELYHAKAISNFLKGESLTTPRREIVTPEVSDAGLRAFALQSDEQSLVWVHNNFYTWHNIGVLKKKPRPIAGARLNIPVRKDGAYRVELWDTRSGKVVKRQTVEARGSRVVYELPPVDKDVALKVALVVKDSKETGER